MGKCAWLSHASSRPRWCSASPRPGARVEKTIVSARRAPRAPIRAGQAARARSNAPIRTSPAPCAGATTAAACAKAPSSATWPAAGIRWSLANTCVGPAAQTWDKAVRYAARGRRRVTSPAPARAPSAARQGGTAKSTAPTRRRATFNAASPGAQGPEHCAPTVPRRCVARLVDPNRVGVNRATVAWVLRWVAVGHTRIARLAHTAGPTRSRRKPVAWEELARSVPRTPETQADLKPAVTRW